MKTLLILRHAKSSWKDPGMADHDRPLNKRGLTAAPVMGQLLKQQGLLPDLIYASTAKRTQETATLIKDASGYEGELMSSRDLYLAAPEAIIDVLQPTPESYNRIMVIGHNPGMEYLVQDLCHQSVVFPTAGLAHVELPIDQWLDLSRHTQGKLLNFWKPKELMG